jgi:outer membrane protein
VRKKRRIWLVVSAAALLSCPDAGTSQDAPPQELSLEEAVRVARQRNPLLQADLNNRELSDWNVRSSYASLIPTAGASSSFSWQGSGEQQFGSITLSQLGFRNQPAYYFSSYSLGLSYTLNGQVLLALPQAKADREAQIAQGTASEAQIVLQVTQAYLEVLRQEEGLKLAEREAERARGNLRLARGQQEVGTGTPMDVRQAEVAVGRARVNILSSENAVRTGKFRLLQQMGLDPQEGFALTTSFDLFEPPWSEESLTDLAIERNPQLAGLRASIRTREYATRAAGTAYLPTLTFSAGLSAFTREAADPSFLVAQAQSSALGQVEQCEAVNELYRRLADPLPPQDCSMLLLGERERRAIVNGNDQFPFNFVRNPPSASLVISLPLFQGLRRHRDLEAARVA